MADVSLQNWKVRTDADGIAWCCIDLKDSGANVLSVAVLEELRALIGELEKTPPRGVVFYSGKEGGFIAGADVKQFVTVSERSQAETIIREAHALFDRISKLPFPTLAMIHGHCLGGGLEFALACRYRLGRDDPKTRLGLPEVMLGIFPGFGGTMRMIRQIGPWQALPLMLAGKAVDARKASKLGLIDRAVPERLIESAARSMLLQTRPARARPFSRHLFRMAPVRSLVAGMMRKELAKRARPEQYPAPFALLEHWQRNGGSDQAMLDGEVAGVSTLILTPASRNLVRAYLLQERLKGFGAEGRGEFTRVHVIGAGVMGGDIAAWCAAEGMQVTLQDRAPKFIAPAMQRASKFFERRFRDPRLVRLAMDRLTPDLTGGGVRSAHVIIEAIIEDLAAKTALFRDLEQRAPATALLATNTSSIPLEEIGAALTRPERLTGIHFFNPVQRMQLVEIVHGPATGADWIKRSAAFCREISRLPLPVRSSPGFLINRVLTPYLLEATSMLQEGMSAEAIDAAAVDFGMPMGPVELADTVGLDICLSVAKHMAAKLQVEIPAQLEQMVKAGTLGRKTGKGFYSYKDGRLQRSGSRPAVDEGTQKRLVLRILNECAACLREGIVDDADLVDVGMIFGTGFAPFRGGPMQYARDHGIDRIIADLGVCESRHGRRYAPDPYWQTLRS